MSITTPVEVRPSTSTVFLDGRPIGHISHPTHNDRHGRYANAHVAYFWTPAHKPTRSDFFYSRHDAAMFIVACAEEADR